MPPILKEPWRTIALVSLFAVVISGFVALGFCIKFNYLNFCKKAPEPRPVIQVDTLHHTEEEYRDSIRKLNERLDVIYYALEDYFKQDFRDNGYTVRNYTEFRWSMRREMKLLQHKVMLTKKMTKHRLQTRLDLIELTYNRYNYNYDTRRIVRWTPRFDREVRSEDGEDQ